MYSTNNKGRSVITEIFIRPLKSSIYKYMTSISKNVYIDKLDDIVKEYNNKCQISIKNNTYISFKKEIHYKDPKLKVGDHVRTSKYKKILLKYIKILYHGHMLLMILTVKILLAISMKKSYKP